ncbi:MAG TPA: HAD family hydrolase [Chitinophagaceae bacterium]|nr:HAD family hydrolase [Chitinophagaceae bacterium]
MKRRIAFFDFDGTITTKDTLLEIIKYQKGTFRFYLGFLLYSPYIILWKLGIIPNYTAKQKIVNFFFGKMPVDEFQRRCDAFATEILPALLRPKAIQEIKRLQDVGAEVVIVSASPGNWSDVWRKQLGIQSLATRLQIKDQQLTGCFDGKNCHGKEKVTRIKEVYDLSAYDEIYCYGDSSGDKQMLQLATISFYKPFR